MSLIDWQRGSSSSRAVQRERVLVATDGGLAGVSAMHWIAERAGSHPVDVEIAVVQEIGADGVVTEQSERIALSAADLLAAIAPTATVHSSITFGAPRRRLQELTDGRDLLVVGTNRVGSVAPHLFATFSTKVAEDAACPTVLVPRGWTASSGPVVAAVSADGSDAAAVRWAAVEAHAAHRDLVLVHAWGFIGAVDPFTVRPLVIDDEEAAQQAALDAVADLLRVQFPTMRITAELRYASPDGAVRDASRGASLAVVGTHALPGITRILERSISRPVLEHPACPVAIVRP